MIIRRAQQGDGPRLRELHELALRPTGALLEGPHAPDAADLDDVESAYHTVGGEFLVGEIGGSLVAMGGIRRVSAELVELTRMRVHPQWQRRGLGRQMLERLEERASELGASTVRLETTLRQAAARALYGVSGYREIERRTVHGLTVVVMDKSLRR